MTANDRARHERERLQNRYGRRSGAPVDGAPQTERDSSALSRRGVVAAGTIGAGLTAAGVFTGGGAWAQPAIRQALGAPRAAASAPTTIGYNSTYFFEGRQWLPLVGRDAEASAPQTMVMTNPVTTLIGQQTAVPAGSRASFWGTATSEWGRSDVLDFDGDAMVAGATLDGTPLAPAALSFVYSPGQIDFTIGFDLEPGTTLTIPVLIAYNANGAVDYNFSVNYPSGSNYGPDIQYRTEEPELRVPVLPFDIAVSFDGTSTTLPTASGSTFAFPSHVSFTNGTGGAEATSAWTGGVAVTGAVVIMDELAPDSNIFTNDIPSGAPIMLIGPSRVDGAPADGAITLDTGPRDETFDLQVTGLAEGSTASAPVVGCFYDGTTPSTITITAGGAFNDLDPSNDVATWAASRTSTAVPAPSLSASFAGSTVKEGQTLPETVTISNALGASTLPAGWRLRVGNERGGYSTGDSYFGQPISGSGFVVNSLYYGTWVAAEIAPGASVTLPFVWGNAPTAGTADLSVVVDAGAVSFVGPYSS